MTRPGSVIVDQPYSVFSQKTVELTYCFIGWSFVAFLWWAVVHGVEKVGLDWNFILWTLLTCFCYALVTENIGKFVYQKIAIKPLHYLWFFLLLFVLLLSLIGIISLLDWCWLKLSDFSQQQIETILPRRAFLHFIFLSAWLTVFHLHKWRQGVRFNPELTEEPSIYVNAQLIGWFCSAVLWYLLVMSGPVAEVSQFSIYMWLLLISCVSLLISHCILRPFLLSKAEEPFGTVATMLQVYLLTLFCAELIMWAESLWIPITGFSIRTQTTAQYLVVFFLKQVFFLIWALVYISWLSSKQKENEKNKRLLTEMSLQQAQLSGLKQQLNPHFLFNTLNSLRAMIIKDQQVARNMVTSLSNLLRYSLYLGEKDTVSLEQEMDIVNEYLDIEKVRFQHRVSIHYNMDEVVLSAQVLPLSVQTLVENAIKHALQQSSHGMTIEVSAVKLGDRLSIRVDNSGSLKPNDSGGIGLANTQQRLRLVFGNDASLVLVQLNQETVRAEIVHRYQTKNSQQAELAVHTHNTQNESN